MALSSSSLQDLASAINSQVSTITEFHEKNGLTQPGFAVDALRSREFPENLELEKAYMELIENASDLLHLALGPGKYLNLTALSIKHDQLALQALSHYNVFDTVPLAGSMTYAELAEKCNIPERRLRRFVKHAIANRIFWAPTPDSVAHTITSAEVVRSPLLYAWIAHNAEDVLPGTLKVVEAMDRWGDSEDPAQAGIPLAFDLNGQNVFYWAETDGIGEYVEGGNPRNDRAMGWRARRFGAAMKHLMSGGPHASAHIHGGFDWDSLGKATVVDCGGSTGHDSVEIASKHQDLTLVVQDFASYQSVFETTVTESLKSRISFQVHDFFTPQPVIGAAVYFFKFIFHDWPDTASVKILQNVLPAMKPGSKIIIMDVVMPEIGQVPNFVMKMQTSLDLQMMTGNNAKERGKGDWEKLLRSADERLSIKAIKQPPGSAASLIEVVFDV